MPYQQDLFVEVKPATKSQEDEYREYIASKFWKAKREQALYRAGYKCEACGISKWSAKLEVHHKTYERFKAEHLDDLIVLCPKCHEPADKKREQDTTIRKLRRLENARFNGWAEKVYGEYWGDRESEEAVYDAYERWCAKQGEY